MLVLLLAFWNNHVLWLARMACAYSVAVLVIISGLHYSITVSRAASHGKLSGPFTADSTGTEILIDHHREARCNDEGG